MARRRVLSAVSTIFASLVIGVPGGLSATPDGASATLSQAAPAGAPHRPGIPFTGLDLALIVGGGSGLIAVGAGLRYKATRA